jgi:hypothetical protein
MQAMYYLIAKMRWGTQRRERSVMISRKKRTAMISRDVSVGAKCTVNNGATLLYVPSYETFDSLCYPAPVNSRSDRKRKDVREVTNGLKHVLKRTRRGLWPPI